MKRCILSFCFLLFVLIGHCITTGQFTINKGINLSHWLSQRSTPLSKSNQGFVTYSDFKVIASLGFDHVRLPIDEEVMWNENGEVNKYAFKLLHNAIKWAIKCKLNVVVDLHIVRSHYFNAAFEGKINKLWTDPKEQEHFVDLWKDLSEELCKYPNDRLAYEIMNEPTAPQHDQWNQLIEKTYSSIRELEKERVLIFGSNMWQSVDTFKFLNVPSGDKNILLSCHFYEPFLLTHYKAEWTEYKDVDFEVNYPGEIIDVKNMEKLSENEKKKYYRWKNVIWNKDLLKDYLIRAKFRADELGLNLYCGEFGVYKKAPKGAAYKWYRDLTEVFDELNIAWCKWDYKGGYSIYTEEGNINSALLESLGLK